MRALLWHEYMPRNVCVTHPLYHRLQFVPNHARLLSNAASVHWHHELMSVAYVSMHTCQRTFTMTREYSHS